MTVRYPRTMKIFDHTFSLSRRRAVRSRPHRGEGGSRSALHKSENAGCVAMRHPIHKNIRMVRGRKAAGEGGYDYNFPSHLNPLPQGRGLEVVIF